MKKERNGYLFLCIGLILLSAILSLIIAFLIGREKIILVPPSINKTFWVSSNAVSPEYLQEMASFFAFLRFNVTPANASTQREMLLNYVEPSLYNDFNAALIKEADTLNNEHMTLSFYPIETKVDSKNLRVLITGDLVSTIGDITLTPKRMHYLLSFRYTEGRLWVSAFSEVNHG